MELSCKNHLAAMATRIRMAAIDGVFAAQSGHPGGSLSVADMMAYLYFKELRLDVSRPRWEGRDRLVLSKGHTAPALYGALMKVGYKGVFMYELKRGEGSFGEMVAIYEKLASDAAKLE